MPQYANNGQLIIMSITKGLIAIIIVASVCYCMVTGQELTHGYLKVILLVLGGYFGLSAKLYRDGAKNQRVISVAVQKVIAAMEGEEG